MAIILLVSLMSAVKLLQCSLRWEGMATLTQGTTIAASSDDAIAKTRQLSVERVQMLLPVEYISVLHSLP